MDVFNGWEVVYERTDNATQCWCEAGVGKYERGAGIVQECHWLLSGVGYAELPRFTFIYGRILALASVLTKRLALILQNPLFFTSFFRRSTLASLAFCKNIANNWRSYSVSTKKETSFFVLCSTFRNFAAIRTSFAHHHGVGNVATKPLRN
jgi:hypothetical protein